MRKLYFFLIILFLGSCRNEDHGATQFTLLSAEQTNVSFENTLGFDADFNIYTYRNFYNGGGVGIGDFNNDGLNDIYFTANMLPNQLYINNGDFEFTEKAADANVAGTKAWSTGVALVDINTDGWLDIYVCNSGDVSGDDKENELFINQKDGSFTEQAEAYGLDDKGFSTHAAFFDYDGDGDLDCYVLNNSYRSIGSFNLKENERAIRDEEGGDKLLRNDDGQFVDVSEEAGIFSSEIGFGLGVTVGDVNRDGWQDIFVSNDFFERDYLYINQQDGTFLEELTTWLNSTSAASMGADMVDFNNDLWPDIFVTEMLPEDNARLKTKTTFESWDNYQFKLKNDYYHQFTRNMMQINKGNGAFAEVGRYAGVSATDWSWAALGADFNLDGQKEIFVANGIYQDLTDQDFINFASSGEALKLVRRGHKEDYQKLIDIIPSVPISNYLFSKTGEFSYENESASWGLDQPSHSNGSAYGDLDNDGDLDLVVNNVNAQAFLYRNNEKEFNATESVTIKLIGKAENPQAYGAKIYVMNDNSQQVYDMMPIRGFQSTMAQEIIIPKSGSSTTQDIFVEWPTGEVSAHTISEWNADLKISYSEIQSFVEKPESLRHTKATTSKVKELNIGHTENFYTDFDRSRLLYQMNSRMGPKLAVTDLNKDGLDDFYLCGAKGSAGKLFLQQQNGSFSEQVQPAFVAEQAGEDVDAVFFDIDNDGDEDLYVVRGGSEHNAFSTELSDVLYINENNSFTKTKDLYPTNRKLDYGSCVSVADVNNDGWLDLFVGIRQEADYGIPPTSYILINQKNGSLQAVDDPALNQLGMVTDAVFADLDQDEVAELIVVGEYMGVSIFGIKNGSLTEIEGPHQQLKGWWNSVTVADRNEDGFPDLLLGNHGQNSRFTATKTNPIRLYTNDFDQNGFVEQIVTLQKGNEIYPLTLRHDLIMQLPYLKQKYLKYEDYENATIEDIFVEEQLEYTVILEANEMRSGYLMNNNLQFDFEAFDDHLQLSCINAIAIDDGQIFLGGNQDGVKPEVGRQDASGAFHFEMDKSNVSFTNELGIEGVVNDVAILRTANGKIALFARNNDSLVGYEF